ncbi:hypothetical protein ACWDB3_05895 [Streptomyces bacillaris]
MAGFVDHLPEGASMSVKQLAKQLPLYGQQAISTALTALSVAGHLRRVRCPVGAGEETRWVFRTFWSRTARDNEWWNTFLAAETAITQAAKLPPHLPPQTTRPTPATPATRVLVECTECGTPGPPEALPDGLCRPCRQTFDTSPGNPPPTLTTPADIKTHMANLRNLLKPV